jgi:flagellar biosynthesis protein FlhG
MPDQAERLRQLAGIGAQAGVIVPRDRCERVEKDAGRDEHPQASGAISLLFTSGKGGVGTSNIVLNLAIALGEMGASVVVVDADFGLANLDLLGGIYPRYDLGDVLMGRCELARAVVPGPAGIQVLPGAHASRTNLTDLGDGASRLACELAELAIDFEFMLIDGGSGLSASAGILAAAVDGAVIVTTPEPTSVADAHAAISRFHHVGISRLRVVVSQAASRAEGMLVLEQITSASRQFKGAVVKPLGPGFVRADARVRKAVCCRRPFVSAFPASAASRGIRRIARSLLAERQPTAAGERFGIRATIAGGWGFFRS